MDNNKLVKDGSGFKSADGRFTATPCDEGTVAWEKGGRYMVDDTSEPLGQAWMRVATLAEARAWIACRALPAIEELTDAERQQILDGCITPDKLARPVTEER